MKQFNDITIIGIDQGYGNMKTANTIFPTAITAYDTAPIQARHRLEAVQARNRQKERKARTRRLIQEGAILESVWPEIRDIPMADLPRKLHDKLSNAP